MCCLFSLYRSLGYGTTSFDGEIIAISESLRNLLCHISKFKNAVILSDSKAAILSIVSKHTLSSQTAEITKMLSQLISLNKRIVFQWIPSHCGILGNENADALAKKGSTATYRPVTKSTYYSVKRFIKSTYLDFNKKKFDNIISREKMELSASKSTRHDMTYAEFNLARNHGYIISAVKEYFNMYAKNRRKAVQNSSDEFKEWPTFTLTQYGLPFEWPYCLTLCKMSSRGVKRKRVVLQKSAIEKRLSSSLLSKNLKVIIYKSVILPVVLYGCVTLTLTLREEYRLRVFENKVLRKIFGAKRDEVTGEWKKLHNTELHAFYSSPDIIRNIKCRRLRWAGHVARMGESRNAYRVLVGRSEGKRPLGRPRRRWEDNIKMDLREVGYDDREWINFAQDRDQWRAYVRAAMNLRVKVFENKVLRKIFGAKRDEVTGEWRKLHNTELHALYSSPDIIRDIKCRRLRWAGHVARMGESRNAYRVLVGRPEGKRPLGRPRRRWEDNIKMDLREVGYDDREWINFAQDRDQWRAYVRAAMNLRVP
ncbi:hypothetical protein ANN_22919 [Periplaneta americana]|uniref:RNase H type-1 domain-containing protein n=1 Tax=Periplaneta americana TaxID=6978 RepID=A0ABQ8SKR8_PERAM|nr:hypothetical protein ANN_22919 [Periplaneta americana]